MNILDLALATLAALFLIALLATYRLITVLNPRRPKAKREGPTHLLIVLGSGGHTAEMLAMLERATTTEKDALNWQAFTHRTWVISSGDSISAERARQFEEKVGTVAGSYDIQTVPRAREIHQPLYTAPLSSFRCLLACIGVLNGRKGFPDLILCNGPATATIVVFTSVLLRFCGFGRGRMRTVYVESWARVERLSLSGRLLLRVVDRFLVQWPQLEERVGGRAEFVGVLV